MTYSNQMVSTSKNLKLLEEEDFETDSNAERTIWTASHLKELFNDKTSPWLHGLALIGRANYHSPSHTVAPESFKRHYEIIYVEKGKQSHWLDNKLYSLTTGDCLLIKPSEQHYTSQPESRGRFYWWIFNPANGLLNLNHQRSHALLTKLLQIFGHNSNGEPSSVLKLNHKYTYKMKQQLSFMFSVWQKMYELKHNTLSKSLSGEFIYWENQLLSLFLLLLESQDQFTKQRLREDGLYEKPAVTKPLGRPTHPDEEQKYMSAVVETIKSNLYTQILFEDLVALTPYSQSHFLRLFREKFGLPLRDFINQQKIILAQEIIQQGEQIAQVSMKLCFSSTQYFAVVFRRYAGMSPSEWQQKSQVNISEIEST